MRTAAAPVRRDRLRDRTLPLTSTGPAPYANPYVAGVGIGIVMLLAFVLIGRGLGASGAFSTVVAASVEAAAPERVATSAFYPAFLGDGSRSPLADWLVLEIAGVTLGGLLSALIAGRFRITIERGPRIAGAARLAFAFGGGILMGFGGMLARGCTSGLGLTGGALLGVGAWIFIAAAFAAAYLCAPLLRRQWT